jgi:hypothetical protein
MYEWSTKADECGFKGTTRLKYSTGTYWLGLRIFPGMHCLPIEMLMTSAYVLLCDV